MVEEPLIDKHVNLMLNKIPKKLLIDLAKVYAKEPEFDDHMSEEASSLDEMAMNIVSGVLYSKVYKLLTEGLGVEEADRVFLT